MPNEQSGATHAVNDTGTEDSPVTAQMLSVSLAMAPAGPRTAEAPALDSEPDRCRELEQLVPVRPQMWTRSWPIEACVPRLARLHARTRLSIMSWSGNQNNAVQITTELVQNAVDHVGAGNVEVTLSVDEDDVLLIGVSDPRAGHCGLDEALAGRHGTGLWIVRQLSGEVGWSPAESGSGKTIRVRLQPGEVETTAPSGQTP
ncbi:ATP-binding protein [Streptomyces nodosus]|uniref:ATP-binding protein n=1 Tax=Streptomyces nodosus TaxID=40318 RepID=UPI003451A509